MEGENEPALFKVQDIDFPHSLRTPIEEKSPKELHALLQASLYKDSDSKGFYNHLNYLLVVLMKDLSYWKQKFEWDNAIDRANRQVCLKSSNFKFLSGFSK